MARQRTDLEAMFRAIEQAGSIDAYIDAQLRERGFMVQRQATDNMSQRELARYKKQLKEEAAEKRRLRAAAWQAYETQNIVHLGEGVFWNDGLDYDKWDLEDAEARAAENQLPPLDKPAQLAQLLELSVSQLRHLAYHRDAATMVHYRRFTIPKRNGGERAIWAPLPRLKRVQRTILRLIVERLLVHGAAHGFLPGRSIVTNAAAHANSRIVLKMDLQDFFPTLTLPRVRGVFRHAGYREQIATLLALLCTEAPRQVVEDGGRQMFVALGPRCLPQGAPTSPALTNVVCLRMDRRLTGLAARYGWRYTRYADDLTFSLPRGAKGEPHLGRLMGLVSRVAADEGFQVRRDKTRVARAGGRQAVTGMVVNGPAAPRAPRRMRRQIRAAIHNLSQGKPLQNGETAATLRGYIAFIAMSDRPQAAQLSGQLDAALGGAS